MDCGEKIAVLRRSKGMTQAELGAELNITFQAVSKWERGESYPDFPTLCKIAKMFGVSVEYFNEDTPAESAFSAKEVAAAEASSAPAMLGVCTICGRVVHEGEEYSVSPAVICKACNDRRLEEEKKEQFAQQFARGLAEQATRRDQACRETTSKKRVKYVRNKGLILAAIICGVWILLTVGALVFDPTDITETIWGSAILVIFLYAFVAQLAWGGTVRKICLAGGAWIGTPGVIFSFDLDGFIFLIVMQFILAIFRFAIFLLSFVVCALVALLVSPFTFIPRLISVSREDVEID